MKIYKNNGVIVELEEEQFTIITSNGEVDLDSIYEMLMKNKNYEPNINDECFDKTVDIKIRDGLKIFITEIFSKMKSNEIEVSNVV